MRYRSTIVALLLAVLSAGAALYTWRNDALRADEQTTQFRLFDPETLPVDDVTRLVLQRREGPTLVFEADGAAWRQVEPFEYPMSTFSMREFIRQASELVAVATVSPDETDGGLSLDPPLASLTLEWPDGRATVHFGRKAVGGRSYLRLEETDEIFVVGQELHNRAVEMHPNEWRERDLFQHAGVDSERLVIMSPRQDGVARFVLEKDRRKWRMTEPLQTRLDQQKMEEFLARLSSIEASGFIYDQPEDLERFGLKNTAARFMAETPVRTVGEDGVETETVAETLVLGAGSGMSSDVLYAMVEGRPVVVSVPQIMWQELFVPERYLDLTGSGVDPADVFALRISTETSDFEIARDEDDPSRWISPDFDGRAVDPAAVEKLLKHLTQTQASNASQGTFPYDLEVGFVVMKGIDTQPLDTVRIARDGAEGQWILDNGEQIQRIYPASLQMPLTPAAFGLE